MCIYNILIFFRVQRSVPTCSKNHPSASFWRLFKRKRDVNFPAISLAFLKKKTSLIFSSGTLITWIHTPPCNKSRFSPGRVWREYNCHISCRRRVHRIQKLQETLHFPKKWSHELNYWILSLNQINFQLKIEWNGENFCRGLRLIFLLLFKRYQRFYTQCFISSDTCTSTFFIFAQILGICLLTFDGICLCTLCGHPLPKYEIESDHCLHNKPNLDNKRSTQGPKKKLTAAPSTPSTRLTTAAHPLWVSQWGDKEAPFFPGYLCKFICVPESVAGLAWDLFFYHLSFGSI